MQEIFFTILVIWLLFKIFGGRARVQTFTFNQTQNHDHYNDVKKDGKVEVTHIPGKKDKKQNDQGEYVDYEEVK